MEFETILFEKADQIGRITLNQPKTLNALNLQLASDLREVMSHIKDESDLRVLVLTGTGRGFCAGGDVGSFHANLDDAPKFLGRIIWHLHAAITYMLELKLPVIVGINGVTAGAGMGLCLAADLAIAAESAVFTMAYTGIGATPDGSSTYFLPRLIGTRRAMELALTNRQLTAKEALDWGMINAVVPDTELPGELDKMAQRLSRGPTRAYGNTRRLIRESSNTSLATQLENEANSIVAMAATEDFKKGVTAFVEKRKPEFDGR